MRGIVFRGLSDFSYLMDFFGFFFFFFKFLLLFNYSCMPFSPSLHPTPAEPTSLPHLHPPPWFCPCVLYSSSCNPLSSLSPHHSPLPIVRLFLTSVSLVIFCLLFSSVDYVPVKNFFKPVEMHPLFSFLYFKISYISGIIFFLLSFPTPTIYSGFF